MNKKFILGIITAVLMSSFAIANAHSTDELNKRLISCTPSKDFIAGANIYQISGLTGSICIFRIQYGHTSNKADLICKVPYKRMHEMTSFNPLTVQNIKNQYCVISLKNHEKPKDFYY